jgi:hypothetical protein
MNMATHAVARRSIFGNATYGFTIVLLLLASSMARADLSCSGKITAVLLYSDGSVLIGNNWRNDYTKICDTQGGSVPTEVCLAWYGAALKARAENTTVGVYYYGTPSSSCATLPIYSNTPPPAYFGVFQ